MDGDANGDGIYFEVKTSHLGEWKTGEVVTSGDLPQRW